MNALAASEEVVDQKRKDVIAAVAEWHAAELSGAPNDRCQLLLTRLFRTYCELQGALDVMFEVEAAEEDQEA